MKKILVATGTSENKKGFAVDYIKQYITAKGIEIQVVGGNIYEVKLEEVQPDLIVAIGPANFSTEIPIVQGTAFITRIGMEAACDNMISLLK